MCDILKHFEANFNEITKQIQYLQRQASTLLVGSGVQLAGYIAQLFTVAVGLPFFLVGTVIYVAEGLHLLCSTNKIQPQLFIEHQQTVGQFQEASHVYFSKFKSFIQCLKDIVELCLKHPNELVVLRECGQVSTQDILRDISTFMSRLDDFYSSVINSEGIHRERILDEEAMSSNREAGVKKDDSAFNVSEKMMELTRLITAPMILTTRTMIE